jgi:hypothetical protein
MEEKPRKNSTRKLIKELKMNNIHFDPVAVIDHPELLTSELGKVCCAIFCMRDSFKDDCRLPKE